MPTSSADGAGRCGRDTSARCRLAFRLLPQLRARENRHLDPTILLPAGIRVVRRDRLAFPTPTRVDPGSDPSRFQVPGPCLGAALGEILVVGVCPDGIGVTDDHEVGVGVLVDASRQLVQIGAGGTSDDIRIEIKQESGRERDRNALPYPADGRSRNVLLELSRLLVHPMTDDPSGHASNRGTDDGAPRG